MPIVAFCIDFHKIISALCAQVSQKTYQDTVCWRDLNVEVGHRLAIMVDHLTLYLHTPKKWSKLCG